MNPWAQLLEIQDLDTSLSQIEYRRSHLPERETLAAVEQQLADLAAERAVVEMEQHRLQKDQKRIEDEISLIEDKITKADGQLYDGSTSDVKALQALQQEIAMFKRQISTHEDDELEVLEELEPVEQQLDSLDTRADELGSIQRDALTALAEVEAVLDGERDELLAARAPLVETVDADRLAQYESVRSRYSGVAVARLDHGVCKACNMKLSAVEFDRILHLDPDDPVTCEDCGRFLVRV